MLNSNLEDPRIRLQKIMGRDHFGMLRRDTLGLLMIGMKKSSSVDTGINIYVQTVLFQ